MARTGQRRMVQGNHSATAGITATGPARGPAEQQILDAVDEGIVTFDTAQRITFMNTAARQMTGRTDAPGHADEAAAALLDELRAERSPWSPDACPIRATLADGESRHIDHDLFRGHDGGTDLPISGHCVALRDSDGGVRGAVLTFRKVPEQIDERRYRALIAATSDFVWHSTADGRLVDISDAWLDMVGITLDQARGWGWADVVHPEDRDQYLRAWQEAIRCGQPCEREYRVVCRDGRIRHFLDREVPVRDDDGQTCEWIGGGQDITDRVEAADTIRQERERYRTLVESTSAILWRGDPADFRFTYVSPEAETILGYPVERWLREPTFWLEHIHPDDRDWAPRYCARATEELRQHSFDYRMIAADGRTVWLRDVVNVLTEDGRPVSLVGVMVDITSTKETEQALEYVSGLQQILVDIASRLVASGPDDLDDRINEALERVGLYCEVDRSYLIRLDPEDGSTTLTHEWCEQDIPLMREQIVNRPRARIPRLVECIERGETVHVPRLKDAPPEWDSDRDDLGEQGIQSFISVPVITRGASYGYVGFDAIRQEHCWSDEQIRLLRGLADALGATIQRVETEEMLRESRALQDIAGRSARVGGWVYHIAEDRVACSDVVCAIHELSPGSTATLEQALAFYAPESRERMRAVIESSIQDGTAYDEEAELIGASGRHLHVRAIGEAVRDSAGRVVQLRGALQDITEHKRARQEVERLAERVSRTLESITDAFFTVDGEWHITYANREAERLIGVSREAVLGKSLWAEFPDLIGTLAEHEYRRAMAENQAVTFEFHYESVGSWFEINAYPSEEGLAVYFRDITERKRAQEEIEFLALYDPLTGLPNRRLLLDRLEHALHAVRRGASKGAVLFLDLDQFKTLNDTLGHDMGDRMLKQAAERLDPCVRTSDCVARFGGDEFAVILEGLDTDIRAAGDDAHAVAEKILAELSRPYMLGEHERHTTVSVGITLFGDDPEDTPEDVMKRADLAMYQSKDAGRGTVRLFDPAMRAAVQSRVALEGELREALDRDEIAPWYQPQVDAAGRLIGVEALARWIHPERGSISPAQFIPVAEETGLILPLGERILEAACRDAAAWAQHPETADLSVSVNVSARQFHDAGFTDQVRATLARTGLAPERLWLELTESLLIADVDDTIRTMTTLRADGIRFTLDDFGTGYSSLAYLKRLPLDQLKIDQGFVRDALSDPNDDAIVRTIIVLAHTMGMEAVAEGVETESLRERLATHGCTAYQGYLYSRPLPADEFAELAARGHETGLPFGEA
ncbi:bifunctional diguanylate cyclase/phosphodiesterase [Halofilum ochraceum]|uniref:bifunctional diguanylate cyclase/phosphodiesterase n=1 Tax=Halofilum ochraceum TaxID=1611323 RepID=UPI001586DE45|nr:EAL domain-containing protein [Halofilum ochraceum]